MSQLQPSPQIRADMFVKVKLDELDLCDLQRTEREGLDVLAELNDFIAQPGRSAPALHHAIELGRKVRMQMAHLRDVMQARKSAIALSQAAASGHGPLVSRSLPGPGKQRRVIRSLASANNAASDLFDVPGNAPQGWDREGRSGGEAEEARPHERPAKPGGPA